MRALVLWLGFGFVVLELLGFSMFVGRFGFLWLLVEIFLSGIVGARLLLRTLARLDLALSEIFFTLTRESIFSLLSRSMLGALGAFLLLLPGIFSDIVGVILLLASALLAPASSANPRQNQDPRNTPESDFTIHLRQSPYNRAHTQAHSGAHASDDEIIDVEVLDSTQERKA